MALVTATGRLTGAGITAFRDGFAADPRMAGLAGYIIDLAAADVRAVTAADLQRLVATAGSMPGHVQRTPRAYVVSEGLMFGLASIYRGRMSGTYDATTQVFVSRSEAAAWLDGILGAR